MSSISPRCKLPRFYPILDAGLLQKSGIPLEEFALGLREAGIRFLQYRDKDASDELVLKRVALLRHLFPSSDTCLILNDRVPLVTPAKCEGVHVGQEDPSPLAVRSSLGNQVLLGVSTHGEAQVLIAAEGPADYIAIGPVFATSSKRAPDPLIGLEGVRLARRLTTKPLVAIGGISRSNCASVIDAGADSVAIISDLVPRSAPTVAERVMEFNAALR
ncbi:MAG TPA: thiamine phosphate synthase [Acidobacteriaceae bacterium]|nr:thiamine phosphate synthase [Acidobacteriaceae bacterium]